jgi:hypothetical protein
MSPSCIEEVSSVAFRPLSLPELLRRGIPACLDMLANERDHVCGTIDTGESRVEDQLGHARCGLNLDLQNVRLQRIKQVLVQQFCWHLVRYCLPIFLCLEGISYFEKTIFFGSTT